MSDPREPRPNPEVSEVWRGMKRSWKQLEASESLSERRGHAAVLAAHIEEFLSLPESLTDLLDGPAAATRPLILPKAPHRLERARDPFAHAGAFPEGAVLLTGGSGQLTPLLDPDERRLYDPFELSAYSVSVLEPLHLTDGETTAHFRDEEALRRHIPDPRETGAAGAWLLYADPLGCAPGNGCIVCGRYDSLDAAVRSADALADRFGIRILVVHLRSVIHTH